MAIQSKTDLGQEPRLRLRPGTLERGISLLVILAVTGVLLFGWLNRPQLHRLLDPEQGVGYMLGIVGGTMMLVLLGYPLRKRVKPRSGNMGSVGFWFRFHMLLGLLGPTAIMFHSRFGFGSFNSTMALGAMIIVASSGLIGRFLYSRVHRGYSNRKLEMRELKRDMDALLAQLEDSAAFAESVRVELEQFETQAVQAGGAFFSSAAAVISLGIRSRFFERRLLGQIVAAGRVGDEHARRLLDRFFTAVRRAAEFAFYDRLLRLWHLLHLPLFIILVAAAILHIVAVHMY